MKSTLDSRVTRRRVLIWSGAAATARLWRPLRAAEPDGIAPQPYFAAVRRAIDALGKLGAPLSPTDAQVIGTLSERRDSTAVEAAERILDRYTIAAVSIDPLGATVTSAASARRELVEQGWRVFLLRVVNPSMRQGTLSGPDFRQLAELQWAGGLQDAIDKTSLIEGMWLQSELYDSEAPLGAPIEYRIIQLFSRDKGRRKGQFRFYVTAEDHPRPDLDSIGISLDFDCRPSYDVGLKVLDADGQGCMASHTIRDRVGRIYPPQAMRLAPDMRFQQHIYRADGESVRLPDGEYIVTSTRGPEYIRGSQAAAIRGKGSRIEVHLNRWIDPTRWGWYAGETHIHASGCAHYTSPTEGVTPETIIRHVRGEALWIGEVLTWTGGYYYQKQFFTGHAQSPPARLEHPDLQAANSVEWTPRATPKDGESQLRYDIEVSGFPSSLCGHLILLRLQDQDYPGTKVIEDWPSWNLPILKWAKAQRAIAGYAHCGHGMRVDSMELPNYEIPPFDTIGANEAIVDVTHGFADFISGCMFEPKTELNVWYHLLNCGFRLPMVGETDYPCYVPPTDGRPGLGRSYVRLNGRPTGNEGYNAWVDGLKRGKLYYGDGRTHFLEFAINGKKGGEADVLLKRPGTVDITALVAARLESELTSDIVKEYGSEAWHIERARIGNSREVLLELVIDGVAVERKTLTADGEPRPIRFKKIIARSSWVALRILPSGHTYPIFVQVGGKPIRTSRRSAEWCRRCVDKLWAVKSPLIRERERPAAAEAFDHARKVYEAIAAECDVA